MKSYWKITVAYGVFGVAWIVLSDLAAQKVSKDVSVLSFHQTGKGLLFVVASAVLIFLLTRQAFRSQIAHQAEREKLFRKTVSGAHHILLNYLNQMQLVTMEAEKCATFDRDILSLANDLSDQAAQELLVLGSIESVTVENVEATVYRRRR